MSMQDDRQQIDRNLNDRDQGWNHSEPQLNDRLGEEIKNAMASSEKPDDNLNKILMRQVREKEAYLKSAAGSRTISLWFLPMLLNGLLFGMLAFLGYFLIPNMLLAKLVMSACIYMVLAGVALTAAGMWFSDFKEKMVLVLEKGGNKA